MNTRFSVLLLLPLMFITACSDQKLEVISMQEYEGLRIAEVISPSFKDNLIGEEAKRTLSVYLPPGYEETERRYPVVYYYSGFGQSPMYLSYFNSSLNSYFERHPDEEFIVVGIDTEGVLKHSFGRNSPVTGRWEDFSAVEVPRFIEENFRIATERGSTGIAGYSGGASAALNIGLSNPRVYGAVFATSPAIAPHDDPAAFAASKGTPGRRLHIATMAYETLLRSDGSLDESALEKAKLTEEALELIDRRNGRKWAETLVDNLQRANTEPPAIYIGYGSMEWPWLIRGSLDFTGLLEELGIPFELQVFEGGHGTYYLTRQFEESLIPFFAKNFRQFPE